MTWNQQLDRWSESNIVHFIFGLRVLLGVLLLIKGYLFLFRITDLEEVVRALELKALNVTLALLVGWAHLLCGLFIAVGFLTRICSLLMFPFLVGAVFFVNVRQGFVTSNEWLISVIVLYLILFFFIYGNGPISIIRIFQPAESENPQTS